MTEKLYRFAGLEFVIAMPEGMMFRDSALLAPFSVPEVKNPHRFEFSKVDELPSPEGSWTVRAGNACICEGENGTMRYIGPTGLDWKNAYACEVRKGYFHRMLVKRTEYGQTLGASEVLELLGVEHLAAENRGLVLHSAFIEWEDGAILFTAPSGTGKSTQAELWETYRGAELINGDRTAIRIQGEEILAEGIPFCGSSHCCKSRSLPLKAIVYLEQAPVTTIRKLRGYEAFARIWEGSNSAVWSRKDREASSATAETIAARIPVYHMPCTPDRQAVEVLEKTLREGKTV